MTACSVIPPITSPLGAHWDQPARSVILVDDTHAVMTKAAFRQLPEYSGTIPSGVYEGKMWRRHDGVFDPRCKPSERRWLLCWFGPSDKPDCCSINAREILLSDGVWEREDAA